MMNTQITKQIAFKFVLLIGFVSLFADMTYEGARSITGQYLAILGASGTVVGVVAGLGEFVGYGLRLISGYVSDKFAKYWLFVFIGYLLNLLAVPLLAVAGNWQTASALIILERFGKAIRNPSRDAMLSYATNVIGRGWGFGLHQAMDRVGAILGPLIISALLYYQYSYQSSFAILLIPALCALGILAIARYLYPRPQDLEIKRPELKREGITKAYWIYVAAVCCVAAGYVDFPLVAFHFKKEALLPDMWIPIFFAMAMIASGLSALIFGRLYDKIGLSVLIVAIILSSLSAPLAFLDNSNAALFGVLLWGVGLGAQESIMRAYVASLVGKEMRATAYGLFNIWFGLAWFLGSALMGYLYDVSIGYLVIFSVVAQLAAIPILLVIKSHHLK